MREQSFCYRQIALSFLFLAVCSTAAVAQEKEQGLLEFSDEPPEEGYFSPQSLRRRSKR